MPRFGFLLLALTLVLFDRILVADARVFDAYVWPCNMLLLGLAAGCILPPRKSVLPRIVQGVVWTAVVCVPFLAETLFDSHFWSLAALALYAIFYTLIFAEVFRQVAAPKEPTRDLVLGALCGFLLLICIATFIFLTAWQLNPMSFNGLKGERLSDVYVQISYFSAITLSTIGYGDITPATDSLRLLSAFWGITGQFYMGTMVALAVSKFLARNAET